MKTPTAAVSDFVWSREEPNNLLNSQCLPLLVFSPTTEVGSNTQIILKAVVEKTNIDSLQLCMIKKGVWWFGAFIGFAVVGVFTNNRSRVYHTNNPKSCWWKHQQRQSPTLYNQARSPMIWCIHRALPLLVFSPTTEVRSDTQSFQNSCWWKHQQRQSQIFAVINSVTRKNK